MTFQFKKPEDSPGFLLWQLTNHWQRLQRQALIKLGITHAQFVVLAAMLWLSDLNKNEITQKIISELTNIDKMSMSDLVTLLEEKKLIKRQKSKIDGRAFSLSLTEKGQKTALKAVPIVEKIDADFFNSRTPNLARFSSLLKSIILPKRRSRADCHH